MSAAFKPDLFKAWLERGPPTACGHVVMAPVQAYHWLEGSFLPLAGGPIYAALPCMEEPGHKGDHRHTFVWSSKTRDDRPPK